MRPCADAWPRSSRHYDARRAQLGAIRAGSDRIVTDWLSYSLADFVPFSHATYVRLFERYDARFWPAVLVGVGVGLGSLWLLRRPARAPAGWSRVAGPVPGPGRGPGLAYGPASAWVMVAFGVCWGWIAWAFHWHSYASLNWAARYFAAAFALQGVLLIVAGVGVGIRGDKQLAALAWDSLAWSGYGLIAFAVIGMPLLGFFVGLWPGERAWFGLELFGSAPDPTAVATLGLMAIVRGRFAWVLVILPTLWCLISAATLAVLGDPLWPLPLLAVLTLALVAAKKLLFALR
jgi:hypothetical protein